MILLQKSTKSIVKNGMGKQSYCAYNSSLKILQRYARKFE
jgi:hypothetical protein